MSDVYANLRAKLCAELAAGASYQAMETRYGVTTKTAAKWFAESGLTRQNASTAKPMDASRRRSIQRMLEGGACVQEVMRVMRSTRKTVLAVQQEMRGEVTGQ